MLDKRVSFGLNLRGVEEVAWVVEEVLAEVNPPLLTRLRLLGLDIVPGLVFRSLENAVDDVRET